MSKPESRDKDSITEVAEESFVRERPLEIERGAVLAGRYQVEEVIGKGGSGVVLRVFDRTVQNVVALKVLKSELARDAKWDKRFSRELRLGRPIQHPNVCRIFDIGEADGHRFLTMELATGGSLRDELKRRPALERPIEERMIDARAAVEGLAAIHATGVVHRDFKPDNLLRMEGGRLVISDFGLATDAAAAPGVTVMIGTPHYMAPEVLAGEPATARSDVWALGVVLHEIFFGRRPERRTVSFEGTATRPLKPATSLERHVLLLCEECLADFPMDRPADGAEVLHRMNRITAGTPARGLRRLWATMFLVLGACVVALGQYAWRRHASHNALGIPGAKIGMRPAGKNRDLTDVSRKVAEVPGHVHCFALIRPNVARVIWGAPRRAEEIDLATGRRRDSTLDPATYQSGCPALSADGTALLFTAQTSSGVPQVRLSTRSNGVAATTLTSGSEPIWIGGDQQFLYTVDSYHAAVFSLPTMSFNVLADPDLGVGYGIRDKAVSPSGERIAVLYSNIMQDTLVAYEGRLYERHPNVSLANAFRIAFAPNEKNLLVMTRSNTRFVGVANLQLDSGEYSAVGSVPGWDAMGVGFAADDLVVLGRSLKANAWTAAPGGDRQLTVDGNTLSAALSTTGDLLLGRRGEDGRLNIWLEQPGHPARRLTDGRYDVEPAFSPNGKVWAYADYTRHSIMICIIGGSCRALVSDELVPTWPSFSPDGGWLIFMTQLKTTQFTVASVDTGRPQSHWQATNRCSPLWSADDRVWTVEAGTATRYSWVEHSIASGRRTGRTAPLRVSDVPGRDLDCILPDAVRDGRPIVQIRTAESSRLMVLSDVLRR